MFNDQTAKPFVGAYRKGYTMESGELLSPGKEQF